MVNKSKCHHYTSINSIPEHLKRRWYNGQHSCLPSSWSGFDSRPTQCFKFHFWQNWEKKVLSMPWPGFEPGLLRPQRKVLTTILSRQMRVWGFWKHYWVKWKHSCLNPKKFPPRRGIEPRSRAWQARILTTILPRNVGIVNTSHNLKIFLCLRPYHVEHTGSRLITEVKQRRARLVLGWVTAWEYRVL